MIYPLDYGHLAGTTSGDGQELDVWLGSLSTHSLDAIVCTVDLLKNDAEIKLLIGCTEADQQTILSFHNGGPQSAILLRRPVL